MTCHKGQARPREAPSSVLPCAVTRKPGCHLDPTYAQWGPGPRFSSRADRRAQGQMSKPTEIHTPNTENMGPQRGAESLDRAERSDAAPSPPSPVPWALCFPPPRPSQAGALPVPFPAVSCPSACSVDGRRARSQGGGTPGRQAWEARGLLLAEEVQAPGVAGPLAGTQGGPHFLPRL